MAIPVFGQIHAVTFLVPATTGIVRFSRLGKAMRVLAALCVLSCVNIAAQLLVGALGIRNYFLSDYYRIIEVSFLCLVFYYSVGVKTPRRVLIALGILFLVVWLVDMIWFRGADQINSGMAMISRILLIAMALVSLQAAIKDDRSHLTTRPVFWVAIGVILYASGTLVVLGLSNQLLKLGLPYFVLAWHINWGLLIVSNLLYTKAFLCKSQSQT